MSIATSIVALRDTKPTPAAYVMPTADHEAFAMAPVT
jgi:hypothetical protein